MSSNHLRFTLSLWLVSLLGLAFAAPASQCSLVLPAHLEVIDNFRQPDCVWCTGNRGIEYRSQPGAKVASVADGTVSFAGLVANTMYVVVRTHPGLLVTHGRLRSAVVAKGDVVRVGELLGEAGSTLYIGVRRGGTYLNPSTCSGRVRAVLL